jgi:hypothetical protein
MTVIRLQGGRPTPGARNKDVPYRDHVTEPMDPEGLPRLQEPGSPDGLLGLEVTKVPYKSRTFPLLG